MKKQSKKSKGGSMFPDIRETIREAVHQGVQHVWNENEDKIHDYRTEDGVNAVKVSFACDIKTPNGEDAEPEISVDMTVTKSFKAGIIIIGDAANQGRFEFIPSVKGTKSKGKKSKAKKGESAEPDNKNEPAAV